MHKVKIGFGFALILLGYTILVYAGTAYYKEDYLSGSLRICVYDYYGDEYIKTIPSYKLCPLTIETEEE